VPLDLHVPLRRHCVTDPRRRTAVAERGRGAPRKPATRLPHLRKKLARGKLKAGQIRKK